MQRSFATQRPLAQDDKFVGYVVIDKQKSVPML